MKIICKELFHKIQNTLIVKKGVSVEGVRLIRTHIPKHVKIILSSGFGNPEKVKLFLDAEKDLGIRLFDALGVGGVFNSIMATADIIRVENTPIHKVGRGERYNPKLKRVL